MQDRKLITLNEEEIASRGRELAVKAWERFHKQFKS